MCVSVVPSCMTMSHGGPDTLELELLKGVSSHVGAGNTTWVFLQEQQVFLRLSHLSRSLQLHGKEEYMFWERCPLDYQTPQCIVTQTKLYLDYLTVRNRLHG